MSDRVDELIRKFKTLNQSLIDARTNPGTPWTFEDYRAFCWRVGLKYPDPILMEGYEEYRAMSAIFAEGEKGG